MKDVQAQTHFIFKCSYLVGSRQVSFLFIPNYLQNKAGTYTFLHWHHSFNRFFLAHVTVATIKQPQAYTHLGVVISAEFGPFRRRLLFVRFELPVHSHCNHINNIIETQQMNTH